MPAAKGNRKDQEEQAVEEQAQRNAHGKRHDQPRLAHGLRMVHAVEEVCQSLLSFSPGLEVKDKPVQRVFHQRPEKET